MTDKVVPRVRLNDGNLMPIIGFGTYQVAPEAILTAIDAGYRHFDTADYYQNEQDVGEYLRKAIKTGKVTREELFVTSKVWPTWHGKGRPTLSCKRSLEALGFDYIDLLLVHWPFQYKQTDDTYWPGRDDKGVVDLDETIELTDLWKEFEELKRNGLVKSIGVSNFNSKQIQLLIDAGLSAPTVNQVESHPYFNNGKLVEWCRQKGVAVTAYGPLGTTGPAVNQAYPASTNGTSNATANGTTNGHTNGVNGHTNGVVKKYLPPTENPVITELAKKYSVTPAAIIFRWQTQREVIVIPKSSNKDRIYSNINIFHFKLNEDEIKAVNGLDYGLRCFPWDFYGVPNHRYFPFHIEF